MSKTVWLALLVGGFATASTFATGEEQAQQREPSSMKVEGAYFGPQLLTEQEQAAYRARIRSAKTAQEAETIRAEHYELMKARAKEKGIALPEQRPRAGTDTMFGAQLMTEEERAAYRARLRKAKTKESTETLQAEHHEELQARAAQKGVALPQTKPAAADSGHGVVGTIFGEPLMTEEEQSAFRARLRGAKTQEERERIRAEHRAQLQARARDKGVALPK